MATSRALRFLVCTALFAAPHLADAARIMMKTTQEQEQRTPSKGKWKYAGQFDFSFSCSLSEEELIAQLEARTGDDRLRDVVVSVYGMERTCQTIDDVRRLFSDAPVHYDMGRSLGYFGGVKSLLGNGMSNALCDASKDGCKTASDVMDSTWALTHDAVVGDLETIPERFASKQIVKGNDLGEFILNAKLWKHDPYLKAIALGADVETHRWVRPILDRLWGPGSPALSPDAMEAHVRKFFAGRTTIDTAKDPYIFVAKVMHSITFGIELTDEQAEEFQAWQANLPLFIVLPTGLVSGIGGKILTGLGALSMSGHYIRKKRAQLLDTYKAQILQDYHSNNAERPFKMLFDEFGVTPNDKNVHLLAHSILDAMSFAGGFSVPMILKVGLAVIKSTKSELAANQRGLSGPDDVDKFVWEVIRRYPPVIAFSYWSSDETARTVLGLGMALRDPARWEDPMAFKLRELADYKAAATVAFAEQSNGKKLGPYSRGCPAQGLSLVIASHFFEAFHEMQSQWRITTPEDGGVEFQDYPSWIKADFTLTKE